MSQNQKGPLGGPLQFPLHPNNTIIVSVKSLKHFGFGKCVFADARVVGGRPCKGARAIDPTVNKKKPMLCCSIRKEHVPADISVGCTMQQ